MMELLRILGLLINHLFDTLTAIDGSLQPKHTNMCEVVRHYGTTPQTV